MQTSPRDHRSASSVPAAARRRAFTLIELMVSIVLVLILILGVNQVFKIASDSTGAGQAVSDIVRDNRAVQTVLYNDLAQSIIRSDDSPCFIIRSTRTAAFLDAAEALSDTDFQALPIGATPATIDNAIVTIDLDGNNVEGETAKGENIKRNDLTRRNYRQDIMCFFARYNYPRQTGNNGTYAANMSSNEAFIWYGQVRQPNGPDSSTANNIDPGYSDSGVAVTPQTNPNNYFARQWGLGRVAVLLVNPDVNGQIFDRGGVLQVYHGRKTSPVTSTAPLSAQAGDTTNGTNTATGMSLRDSRYDLAGTTIDGMRSLLKDTVIPQNSTNPTWYGGANLTPRFAAFPYPTRPLTSYGAARTVPWLVGGCTSFIVEYAGDFITQNNNPASPTYGAFVSNYSTAATDGVVDYIRDTATGERRVRWYGYPRDTNNNGILTLADGDVVPFQEFNGGNFAPFEHTEKSTDTRFPTTYTNPAVGREYICAWGPRGSYAPGVVEPPRPMMLRITMTIDDPRGRLPGGQAYEYVVDLP